MTQDPPELPSDAGVSEPKVSTRDVPDPEQPSGEPKKKSALREFAILAVIAVALYYVMLTFVARPYLIPSESMEPTLHGCT
ncbi:MAG: S26 family signal peptidase, partial [Mycobacterium sp.]